MKALISLLTAAIAVAMTSTATAAATDLLAPPVDAALVRAFDEPATQFGSGHRGIDYAIPAGSSVRAAADGTVTFAGAVAGVLAITIDHGGGMETTYSRMSEVFVHSGEAVTTGAWIGSSANAHGQQVPGLHFGVKLDGDYVDPLNLLGPIDTAGAIALAPLNDDPIEDRHVRACKKAEDLPEDPPVPNDNVAVAIGGILSATDGSGSHPDLYRSLPELGYSPARSYYFSYRGAHGPSFHAPYGRSDTFVDIQLAAQRLAATLARIARVHPGAEVDLIAHSQGGIVGRTYLVEQARAWDQAQPRIEHFVTFASPHGGVPAASETDQLRTGPLGSRFLASGMDLLADRTDLVPPVWKGSVPQMRTDSELLTTLDRQDVLFGTRVLTLGIANDLLVPAGRTRIPGKPGLTVPAQGMWGHSRIVESRRALQIAHAFLAGAGVACAPELGLIERAIPTAVDKGQSAIGEVVNALSGALLPL